MMLFLAGMAAGALVTPLAIVILGDLALALAERRLVAEDERRRRA